MAAGSKDANPKVEKILAGARAVFFEHGFGGATTDMVQQAAGVSKSTVYAYFPSKDALFIAVVRAECRKLIEGVHGERIQARTSRDTLSRVGLRLLETILAPSAMALLRIVIAEAPRFPDLGGTICEAGSAPMHQELADYLAEVSLQGDLRVDEPHKAARHFIAMVLHDAQMECLLGIRPTPNADQAREIVDAAVADFLRAYSPS